MTRDVHPPEAIMAAAAAASWPSWHYDAGRSVYWHLCTHHLAYVIQTFAPHQGVVDLSSNNGEMHVYQATPRCICEQNLSRAPCRYEEYDGNAAPSGPVEESESLLPPGWVEEFLIDCYLGGCFSTSGSGAANKRLCMDNGVCEEPVSYDSYAVDVETPGEMHTLNCDDKSLCSKALLQEGLHKSGEKEDVGNATEENESLLQAWQAQYGQVVRSNIDAHICPQATNLWNWSTCLLKGSKSSICLRGQLTQTASRLLPYSQHCFMKTACVREVNLDLVKVASGEIYRLRQPSSKYLRSVSIYDSSNPTKDWNFPCFSFSDVKDAEGHSECVPITASSSSLVVKPFVPNLNHQRYQHLNKRKIGPPAIPASIRALSSKETALSEERARKYRDRAEERREVHGVDTEYAMHHNKGDLCLLPKNMKNGCEEKPKRHSKAQHMMERMGWFEGEGLGKRKDGLKEPLKETRNLGQAGIGWFS